MGFAFTFRYQQGKQYIHGLVIDRIKGNALVQSQKYGREWVTVRDTSMVNGDGSANAGTAHFFTCQQAFKELLFIQPEPLGGQFTDEFNGSFFIEQGTALLVQSLLRKS